MMYDLGAISRYALVVRAPNTHQILGVIQVGVPIGGQLRRDARAADACC